MNRVMLLSIAGAAACAQAPSAHNEASTTFVHGDVKESGEITVTAAMTYEILFPAGDVVKLPTALSVGTSSSNVLGATDECNHESLVGAGMYPVTLAVGGRAAAETPDQHSYAFLNMTGPAVAKVTVDTVLGYTCGHPDRFSVQSAFTFFPDGRIVRVDTLTSSAQALTPAVCGCGPTNTGRNGTDYYMTSWWAFVETGPGFVDGSGVTVPSTTGGPGPSEVCANLPGQGLVGIRMF